MRKRFYLYERRRPDKPSTWYVRFREPNSSIGSPVSSGQAAKGKARQWALEQLLTGQGSPPGRSPGTPSFATVRVLCAFPCSRRSSIFKSRSFIERRKLPRRR